jgi:hypothetical protein
MGVMVVVGVLVVLVVEETVGIGEVVVTEPVSIFLESNSPATLQFDGRPAQPTFRVPYFEAGWNPWRRASDR